jgi:hypothetical protein
VAGSLLVQCPLSSMSDSGRTTTPKDKFHCYLRNAMQENEPSAKSAKDIVTEWMHAVERRDYQSLRGIVSDNISYVGPLNSFDRAEPYLKYLEQLNLPKFDIKKEFADSNDVCLLYELPIGTPPVASFVCAWVHVGDDGKISSLRIIFDPRPYLQQK